MFAVAVTLAFAMSRLSLAFAGSSLWVAGERANAVSRVSPGTNTRLYARYRGNADSASPSVASPSMQVALSSLTAWIVKSGSLL